MTDLSYLTFAIILILVWEFFKWINIEYNPAFKRWKKYSEDSVKEFIKKLKTRFCPIKQKGFCNTCYDCANINKFAEEMK